MTESAIKSGLSKRCFWQTVILSGGHPPFSSISGVEEAKSLVFVGRMQYQNFRQFRQNHPFSAGDKTTVYQNDRFDNPDKVALPVQKTFHYLWRFYFLLFRGFFVALSWLFRGPCCLEKHCLCPFRGFCGLFFLGNFTHTRHREEFWPWFMPTRFVLTCKHALCWLPWAPETHELLM